MDALPISAAAIFTGASGLAPAAGLGLGLGLVLAVLGLGLALIATDLLGGHNCTSSLIK